jgi:UDP-glucose 4-epimerase
VKKTVLVTGAAGFVGSHLVERCLASDWTVIAVDAFTDYYDESLKRGNIARVAEDPDCTVIEGDLLELDLAELLQGVTTVFHLAAQPGVRTSWDHFGLYTRNNVAATQRLLHAASRATLGRFVIASSSSVYGDAERMPTPEDVVLRPVSPYGLTKVAAEQLGHVYWRNFAVPTVCLRYFTVFGPRQRPDMAFHRLISSALAHRPFSVYGDGKQTRDFTYIDDAVEGTIAAGELGRPGAVYNIGGGSRRSVNDVLGALARMTGSPIDVVYREQQPGDARDTAADIERARNELGFEPTGSFERGLGNQLGWQAALTEDSVT